MPKVRHHFFTAMVVLSSNEKSYLMDNPGVFSAKREQLVVKELYFTGFFYPAFVICGSLLFLG